MLYFAYLDEFGHIGPYIARNDPAHNDSPVFGLGGMILPYNEVRAFSTWYYQLKIRLLQWEIDQAGAHPSTWEKKGAALYTTRNVTTYRELRQATFRILNRIRTVGGHVFYVGLQKNRPVAEFNAQALYLTVLGEAMKRLNQYAGDHDAEMIIIMDEHQDRERDPDPREPGHVRRRHAPAAHHRAAVPGREPPLSDLPVRRLAMRAAGPRRAPTRLVPTSGPRWFGPKPTFRTASTPCPREARSVCRQQRPKSRRRKTCPRWWMPASRP